MHQQLQRKIFVAINHAGCPSKTKNVTHRVTFSVHHNSLRLLAAKCCNSVPRRLQDSYRTYAKS